MDIYRIPVFTIMRHVKRAIRFVVYLAFSKRSPSITAMDIALINDLRNSLRPLLTDNDTSSNSTNKFWSNHEARLAYLAIHDNPRCFLRWDVIQYTMFATRDAIKLELSYLKSLPDWKSRWKPILEESHVGHPPPYWRYPRSSGNLIHHAYNVAQFQEKTQMSVRNMDYIFEFGGGYGNTCRLIHDMGFTGTYVLYDLPGFSALQEFYLKSLGQKVLNPSSIRLDKNGIVCISNLDLLRSIIPIDSRIPDSMFIATWSLSETPLQYRDTITSLVSGFQTYLIASQSTYDEIDNIGFFQKWRDSQPNITWQSWQIDHLGRNFYMVGQR